MNRTRYYYRKERAKHISRKKRIIHSQGDYYNYKFSGQLSKGKIHCSCWMCSGKTAIHGYKPRDLKEIERCNYGMNNMD